MYKIERMPHSLEIGYVGEKNFRPVEIDMTAWMEKMPEGVPSIVCIRPGETKDDAYIAVTTFEDNILTWVPSDADLGVMEGEGMIQVWLEEEENSSVTKRGKSIEVITKVKDSVSNPSADTPAPQASFLEQMTELKTASVNAKTAAETAQGKAEDAQEDAEDAAEDAEAYAKGTRDGSAVTSEDPAYHNNAKYYAEQAGTSATSAGTSATNAGTAKENAEAYAVGTRNGTPVTSGDPAYHNNAKYYAEQVDPTSIIDDTAGEGQTGKTWSADKLDEEFGDVLNDIESIDDRITKTVTSKNLINPNTLTTGRLQSDGTVNSMSNYRTSDYIPIETGKKYIFARESLTSAGTAMIKGYAGYGFYDSSKTWVANSRVWDNDTVGVALVFTASANGYVRVCGETSFFSSDTSGLYILQEGETLDGYEAWHLPQKVVDVLTGETIVQSTGNEIDKVMSQKAVTDLVSTSVPAGTAEVVNDFHTAVGKNKYNKDACNPQNGKYYDGTTGAAGDGSSYAITGKIPVKAETRYVFSTTQKAVTYSRAAYYSGADGSTFISREAINGASFVTPQNCTFVGIDMFASSHTTEEYEQAIAAAQLEEGSIPTSYEAYTEKLVLSVENVEGGDSLATVEAITKQQSQVNLYDKTLAKNGKYYNQGVENSDAGWAVTGKIPVLPNTQYNLSKNPSAPLALLTAYSEYDESGTWLRSVTAGYNYLVPIKTDSDTYFISVNMKLDSHTQQDFDDTIDTLMLCYGTSRPYSYSAYNPVPVVKTQSMENAHAENVDRFKGKKWLALGTSITWYDGKAYQLGLNTGEICRGYVGQVARNKKLIVTNEGINGSTLGNYDSYSLINRYQSLDFEHADICTIEYGVNDLGKDIPVGTESDAAGDTTFAACLKTVIEYALAENPQIILVICTDPDVRGTNLNNNNNTLKDFTDVTLAIAKQYRLPVCDWYYQSGINALNKGDSTKDWMTADGTHPNDIGHNRMGAILNKVIDSLLC